MPMIIVESASSRVSSRDIVAVSFNYLRAGVDSWRLDDPDNWQLSWRQYSLAAAVAVASESAAAVSPPNPVETPDWRFLAVVTFKLRVDYSWEHL